MIYFDCNCRVGPRPDKHARTRWSVPHLLEDMDQAEIAGALALERININDIEIMKVREGVGGTIRLGFDTEAAKGASFGLLGMRERMEMVGGTFLVTTLPAPIIACSPMVTLGRMVAPEPIDTPFLTSVVSTFQSASVCSSPDGVVARG